jgi:transcriptional regulator with XRE-family HTH domain
VSTPEPPPEAALIRRVRQAARISTTDAAQAAGISKPWWSMIEAGHSTRGGVTKPVVAKADVLAAMARAVGITPERLREVRPDAADILDEAVRPGGAGSASMPKMGVAARGTVSEPASDSPVMLPALVAANWEDANVRVIWGLSASEEGRLGLIRRLLGLPDEDGPARRRA